jgi:hypothetical protein
MLVRWLHLSDIHERQSDRYARRRMYLEIVKEVSARSDKPHLVFLTGDLAFKGAVEEYRTLEETFIHPLKQAIPSNCPIFMVPGNHDLDRARMTKPRLWIRDPDEAKSFQAPDSVGAKKRTEMLGPRFAAYSKFDRRVSSWGSDWLSSEAGSALWTSRVNDVQISVIGLNTAWLCQDDEDWGQITPGRYLLERSLDEAMLAKPDLVFVLGHHPLAAFGVEREPKDGLRIRYRLAQANALYLHGHLHASGKEAIGEAFHSALAIQAPSAFQMADSDVWRNGILWGEADISSGMLVYEPFEWNDDRREYQFDTRAGYNNERVPGRDAFQFPLPNRALAVPGNKGKASILPVLPAGWEIVQSATLAAIRSQSPTTEEIVSYFDGNLPNWRLALARGVQPRAIAGRLAARLRAAYIGSPKPQVVLLEAAGGEGKSTAILHAAAALIEDKTQNWSCLHRQATAALLPEDLFAQLPHINDHAWIVVVDDAENAATSIVEAIKQVVPRTDVHFLLAARDTDWRIRRLIPGMWQSVADFRSEHLAGLDENDARRIVQGWRAWGDVAMGSLPANDEESAVKALVAHAKEFAVRRESGELLGALLLTRQGEDMKAHVRTFIDGLGREPAVGKYSLRDIYAMVAAMHAENQLYLSLPVLAFATGRSPEEIDRRALQILRREAMLDSGETCILIRHRRIAEAACSVLRDDSYDIDSLYPFLASAARRHFITARRPEGIAEWTFGLARHFAEKGERTWPVAALVAEAIFDADRNNFESLTALSAILRRIGRPTEAMGILKASDKRFHQLRSIQYEWSSVAGALGNYGLSVWLGGKSLADRAQPLDDKRIKLSLAGLGVGFRALHDSTGNKAFATGMRACGQIGLRAPDLDQTAQGYFERYVADGNRIGIGTLSLDEGIEAIRQGVILGADEVDPDSDPVMFERLLGDPSSYRYTSLAKIVQ